MGNVDGVPVASQVKSIVQASTGDRDAAWDTQRRFSERCIGVAQVRTLAEMATGDVERAAETQRRFIENSQQLLNGNSRVDAVPLVSQLKAVGHVVSGDLDAAVETQDNFSRYCPGVSQLRSGWELATDGPDRARQTQAEFFTFASETVDNVPLLGHAKGWLHHAMGDHERAQTSLTAASSSTDRVATGIGSAMDDIFGSLDMQSGARSSSGTDEDALMQAMMQPQTPLNASDMREHTVSFQIAAEGVASHQACPICLDDFTVGAGCLTLRCLHVFHRGCAEKWLQQHGNCPVCRIAAKPTALELQRESPADGPRE